MADQSYTAEKVHDLQKEIELLKQCNATDRGLEIVKLREEIKRLKAHTLRLESSLQKTEARYNDQTQSLESSLQATEDRYWDQAARLKQAEADKEQAYATIRMLNKQVLQQIDTIKQLKAQPPKMTWGEARFALWGLMRCRWHEDASPSKVAAWVCDYLRSKGMLAEDAPVILTMEEADALEPVDEQPAEVDPLKVDMHDDWRCSILNANEIVLAEKHNALVEAFRAAQKESE